MSRSIILPNSKDCNSKSLISRFSSLVTAQYIGISARALGFIKRRNNLNPSKLVQALIMTAGESCNIKIASVKERYSSLTRSGEDLEEKPFHNRLRQKELVALMMNLYQKLHDHMVSKVENKEIKQVIDSLNNNGLCIEDIFIHDGSYWHVNSKLANDFPGTRSAEKGKGKAKRATCKTIDPEGNEVPEEKSANAQVGIQTTWSMLHECIVDEGIAGATANERDYVYDTSDKNVLHMFDSGYVSFDMYNTIKANGEFIGKLHSNSAGIIKSAFIGKNDLTEHFECKKLSDAAVRNYQEHRVMDLTVEFKGELYRVIRVFSKKDNKVQYLITSIRRTCISALTIAALYKLRWQIERKFMELKSGSNLRGVNTTVRNIVYVLLFASLIAQVLKTLMAYALRDKLRLDASMYKISVRTYTWFDKYVKALFKSKLEALKSIIYKIAKEKGCYVMAVQSKDKINKMKTLKSTINFIKQSLSYQASALQIFSA